MKVIIDYILSSLTFAVITLPFLLLFRLIDYKKTKHWNWKREILIALFFMSASVIVCQTAIPPQLRNGDFSTFPFHAPDFSFYYYFPKLQTGWLLWKINLKDYTDIAVNIGGNLLIFMPIGFLAPLIWKKIGVRSIFIGFFLSCFVEFVQLFTDRNSDYNDIILNTIGTALGYFLYLFIHKIFTSKKSREC